MADRWPWYRNRSFLSKFDFVSGTSSRLTWGHSSTNLHDISPNGKTLLFSVTEEDFGQRPFSKTKYYELDIQTVKARLLFESRFGGSAAYSPDGNQLLITGSPLLFGETGNAVTDGKTPNDYDTQAYLYRLADGKIDPLTLKFDPSIQACKWDKTGDNILFQAEEKTYVRLYNFNLPNATFNLIPTQVDVVNSFDFAPQTSDIVYFGNGISTPTKAWHINALTNEQSIIADPQASFFKNIKFGKTEDWVYTTPEGKNIDGFINYPPDFDPSKQYPLIVFYYGGTSPIDRAFEGRYPKNLFAAMSYVVYTINPDGATGYGQEFSAMHVNNWGKTVAGQIIDGTKHFLKQHPFIDAKKVGCIGASYGGFMTMYLQTQTDIFATAISHAGISNISSYWGVGYWGYQYSTVASADMYPWNNPDLYVKQSPLFNANKINTPILL
jgi:dipeptidyl aminopeptidase/acylaminoacyl peptidase